MAHPGDADSLSGTSSVHLESVPHPHLVPVQGGSVQEHQQPEHCEDAHEEGREAVRDILEVLTAVAHEDLQSAYPGDLEYRYRPDLVV